MSVIDSIKSASATARTLGGVAGLNAGMAAGIGLGALTRDPLSGRNFAGPIAFDFFLLATGVTLDVRGREHLESARPAVFAFNHQSNLDPMVVSALVRHDFTSTGKAEVKKDPAAMLIAYAIDAILIDRADAEHGREQVAKAIARLRGGESVLIAPEGTRNRGPEPGEYKTGVIHMAMQAGVPIVPLVLHDTYERMPKGATAVTPGVVHVTVLPPISTVGWTADEARDRATDLRERMTAPIAAGV